MDLTQLQELVDMPFSPSMPRLLSHVLRGEYSLSLFVDFLFKQPEQVEDRLRTRTRYRSPEMYRYIVPVSAQSERQSSYFKTSGILQTFTDLRDLTGSLLRVPG